MPSAHFSNKQNAKFLNAYLSLIVLLDQPFTYVGEIDYEAKEKHRMSRNGHNRCVTADMSNIRACENHENSFNHTFSTSI